jgi:carboxymethylenebutenolidase
LRQALAKTDVAHTVKVFEGTSHGFCFAERAVYAPVASEQTWSDIFDLFQRRIG